MEQSKDKKASGYFKKAKRIFEKDWCKGLDKKSQHNTKKIPKIKKCLHPYAFFIIRTSTIAYK